MQGGAGAREVMLFALLFAVVGLLAPVSAASAETTTTSTTPDPTTATTTAPDSDEGSDAETPSDGETTSPAEGEDITAAGTFTVTPSTALPYSQTVVVAGSGYAPGSLIFGVQCVAGSVVISGCTTGTIGSAPVDSTGAFTMSLTVYRFVATFNGATECAGAPGTCVVLVGSGLDLALYDVQPLGFDPSAPVPPDPVITVVPDIDLGLEEDVAVAGSGFEANSVVLIRQCIVGATDFEDDCVFVSGTGLADGSGGFDTTAEVRRGFRTGAGDAVDCLDPPSCELVAAAQGFPFRPARAALAFDPAVPVPPPPVIVVTPSTGLADGQVVLVTASGFEPGREVVVSLCPADPDSEACRGAGSAVADATGTITHFTRVYRTIGSPLTDCANAPGACVMRVLDYQDVFAVNSAPLDFDPNAPPVPPPTIDIAPTTGLRDGDLATVSGSGFLPGELVGVQQCRRSEFPDSCDSLTLVFADQSGSVHTTFTVRRTIHTNRFGTVDCVTDPAGCSLHWGTAAFMMTDGEFVPLEFEPDPAPDPAVSSGGLPRTGGPSASLAGIGSGLVLLGVGFLAVARRRARTTRCGNLG